MVKELKKLGVDARPQPGACRRDDRRGSRSAFAGWISLPAAGALTNDQLIVILLLVILLVILL